MSWREMLFLDTYEPNRFRGPGRDNPCMPTILAVLPLLTSPRNAGIVADWASGLTFKATGAKNSLSLERTRQIVFACLRKASGHLDHFAENKLRAITQQRDAAQRAQDVPFDIRAGYIKTDFPNLRERTKNALSSCFDTMGEIIDLHASGNISRLLKIPNFGRKSLRDLKEELATYGIMIDT